MVRSPGALYSSGAVLGSFSKLSAWCKRRALGSETVAEMRVMRVLRPETTGPDPQNRNFSATWITLGLTSDWICPKFGEVMSLTGKRKFV
jgi:hypothetical protein